VFGEAIDEEADIMLDYQDLDLGYRLFGE